MKVKVNGKDIEVAVSEGGMFHDVETKTVSATTLKGLAKKLKEREIPKAGIPVVSINDYTKKGVVTGRVKSRGWRGRNFVVRWENGEVAELSGNYFVRELTKEEKETEQRLRNTLTVAEAEAKILNDKVYKARNDLNVYVYKFGMASTLESAFPRD